jgi:hypothetical protein
VGDWACNSGGGHPYGPCMGCVANRVCGWRGPLLQNAYAVPAQASLWHVLRTTVCLRWVGFGFWSRTTILGSNA